MMQRKFMSHTLLAALLLASVPLAAVAQAKDPVKVGLVSTKTGVWAEMGEEVF
jgi:branched-chain amino acid transport system substrate-binding protein